MSESKRKHIFYRNNQKEVDENGYVTIEGEPYLVVKAVDKEFITKHFKETKKFDIKPLDDICKNKKCLDDRYVFDCEISFLHYFIDSVLWIFDSSIFLKKVTIKSGYMTRDIGEPSEHSCGKLNPDLDRDSNVPNFAFCNAKFEDECLIEFDHNENNLSFIFHQCHFAKKLKIRNNEQRIQLLHKPNFEHYKIAQKTKLHLNKLHLIDCSANDGAYLRIGFVSVKDFILSNAHSSSKCNFYP